MNAQSHAVRVAGRVRVEVLSPALAMVSLIGEHDLGRYQLLGDAFASVAEFRDVLVDLTYCSFIDSSAIQIFALAKAIVDTHEGRFALVVPRRQVAVTRVVEFLHFGDLVAVHTSQQSALASLDYFGRGHVARA
jgi:anti-anti-sigma factor